MKYLHLFIIPFFLFVSCEKESKSISLLETQIKTSFIQQKGKTIATRFAVPKNFKRIHTNPNSFAHYLQHFKLKPSNAKVHLHNGALKNRQDIHHAVLDISVGTQNLQQCADATMRLRAEYLFAQKQFNAIHFNFTNGFNVAYSKWRKGFRLKVKGNKVTWYKTNTESTSYKSFQKYMQWIFMYAGTLSLSKEMKPISLKDMQIGDVFIQGGSPGHAIIIVDIAKKDSETLFMLAQSYMPAQEIHILKNLNSTAISPWYSSKKLDFLNSPEWTFSKNDLKRFQ